MKKTFCDGCDCEIKFSEAGTTIGNARVNITIKASCVTVGDTELGQFAQTGLDLCGPCIEDMKLRMNPKQWPRRKTELAA